MKVGGLAVLLALACWLLAFDAAAQAKAPPAASQTKDAAAAAPVSATAGGSTSAVDAAPNPKAQELFDEAIRLTGEGKFTEACVKLEESLKLHEGMGTAFNLARCWQKIGRTASAYALFETVVRKTRELGQLERSTAAQAKLDALLPKLSRLRIDLTARAPNTVIKRNGEIVPESAWEKPLPLDPGSYELAVSADGKSTWSTKVEVKDPGTTIAIVVPALVDAPKQPVPVVVPPPKPKPAEPPPAKKAKKRSPALAIGLATLGVVGIVGGIIKGSEYVRENEQAKEIRPGSTNCTTGEIAEYEQVTEDARAARTWSYASFAVGGVALAAAGYLFFLAPSGDKNSKVGGIRAEPIFDARGTYGASLAGRF